jgi:hypothetical protein
MAKAFFGRGLLKTLFLEKGFQRSFLDKELLKTFSYA